MRFGFFVQGVFTGVTTDVVCRTRGHDPGFPTRGACLAVWIFPDSVFGKNFQDKRPATASTSRIEEHQQRHRVCVSKRVEKKKRKNRRCLCSCCLVTRCLAPRQVLSSVALCTAADAVQEAGMAALALPPTGALPSEWWRSLSGCNHYTAIKHPPHRCNSLSWGRGGVYLRGSIT